MNLIYIPSSGRAKLQSTLQCLPAALHARVRLVVQAAQAQAYGAAGWPVALLVLPEGMDRISPTRAWITAHAIEHSRKAFYVLDDDIRLLRRDQQLKLHKATDADVLALFQTLDSWLQIDGIGIASVSPRFGNAFVTRSYRLCARVSQFLSYRTNIARQITWNRVPVYTEHDATMQVLRLGYATKMTFEWAYQETVAYQGTGGCSVWRTHAIEHTTAQQMFDLHKPYAKLKMVNDKRYDGQPTGRATFKWKQAWLSGLPEELQ